MKPFLRLNIVFRIVLFSAISVIFYAIHFGWSGLTLSTVPFHSLTKSTQVAITVPPTKIRKRRSVPRVELSSLSKIIKFPRKNTRSWPPVVYHIPEPQSQRLLDSPLFELCGNPKLKRCRFMFAYKIGEQESKARIHLMQLIQLGQLHLVRHNIVLNALAHRLNRILVLPKLEKSRLGSCLKWEFDVYYNLERLSLQLSDRGIYVVQNDVFRRWIKTEKTRYSSQMIFLTPKPHSKSPRESSTGLDITTHKSGSETSNCVLAKLGQISHRSHPVMHISPSARYRKEAQRDKIGELLVKTLSGFSAPDIFFMSYEMRYPIFPRPAPQNRLSLDYSLTLSSIVDKLIPRSPYLMVHWRMETVAPDVLHDCGHSLVDTISSLLYDEELAGDVKTVWFASDYPVDQGNLTRSGTFMNFGGKHREAIRILYNAFMPTQQLNKWQLTGLTERIANVSVGSIEGITEELLVDSGVLGILDKLVGMRAPLFVSGAKGCGRVSSFTQQIIDSRNLATSTTLRNVVERFG